MVADMVLKILWKTRIDPSVALIFPSPPPSNLRRAKTTTISFLIDSNRQLKTFLSVRYCDGF
jgi:hypothetical protein